jgi:hypothetical protein
MTVETSPLFIATECFDPSDGEKWLSYCRWANIQGLIEIVSLDCALCRHLVKEFLDEDWKHIVCENFRLDYFYHLDYLLQRVQITKRRNILGLYRNPDAHISFPPAARDFGFMGYDLIEEETQISALNNCGGFPDAFANNELNKYGLLDDFERSCEVRRLLAQRYPARHHAQCELYAIWRLNES